MRWVTNPAGCVYVLRAVETPFVKIGFTQRPIEQRLRDIQMGCPFDLEVEFVTQVPNALRLETELHATLDAAGRHVRGEWFDLGYAAGESSAIIKDLVK